MTCMPTRFSGGRPASHPLHAQSLLSHKDNAATDAYPPQNPPTPPRVSSPPSNKNISMVMGQVFLTHIHDLSQAWLGGDIISFILHTYKVVSHL